MPLEKSYKIVIIIIIALLMVSAAVLRFIPADSSNSLNTMSISDQPTDPHELTDKNVAQALNSSGLFVLDFYYPGCKPCGFVNNTTAELSEELGGQVQFKRMNARSKDNSKTVKDYKITSYPTLIIFDEGILVNRIKGNTSKSELLAELKDLDPGLDTSRVKLPTPGEVPIESEGKPDSSAKEEIAGEAVSLIELCTENPSQAMLVTDDTMDLAISQYKPILLVVVGYTDSCHFCSLFNVTVSELARELKGQVAFGMIDTRRNSETKAEYNITGVPTALIFKDGKLAGKVVGNKNKSIVVSKLKEIEPRLNTSNVKLPAPTPKAPPQPKLTPVQVCVNMTKSDQPLLQAFIVARCPFGLQMQRIMASMIDESEEMEEYLMVRYIGSVDQENNTIRAMHGEVEAQENLRQICIREEQPDRYWNYVRCYMREGKTTECLESVSIDMDELVSCTNDSSRGLVYAQEDFDLASEFKITGSPTMLMNNEIVKESNFATNTTNSRSSEAVKELLCCGFNEKPSFCSKVLNERRAATMFSAT